MENWNDLKLILSVAKNGTLTAASVDLNVDVSTISRRLTGLEKEIGKSLFTRKDRKMMPTQYCLKITEVAQQMSRDINSLINDNSDGIIQFNLTTVESLAFSLINSDFLKRLSHNEKINCSINISNENKSLFERQADIALRLGRPSSENSLISKKIGSMKYGIFSKSKRLSENSPFVDFSADIAESFYSFEQREYLNTHFSNKYVSSNSVNFIRNLICNQSAHGILPVFIGDSMGLFRQHPRFNVEKDIFMIYHSKWRYHKGFHAFKDSIIRALMTSL
ncbi:LysR family transcriptional regulator [Halobacteriovorax sp. CON-3]|uniref:LysR family transcriptional regulator n=1 Tax=Halobacteriovorax sp. CON-3 TaxID=3157710 RepID=UPI0037173D11